MISETLVEFRDFGWVQRLWLSAETLVDFRLGLSSETLVELETFVESETLVEFKDYGLVQ